MTDGIPLPQDVMVACAACGEAIAVQHFVPGGVESEFVDRDGACFSCQRARKKDASKRLGQLPLRLGVAGDQNGA